MPDDWDEKLAEMLADANWRSADHCPCKIHVLVLVPEVRRLREENERFRKVLRNIEALDLAPKRMTIHDARTLASAALGEKE